MNEIGEDFKNARVSAGLSIEEASNDNDIPIEALEQIEAGSIGSFKDIFLLKEYISSYAKYLGMDPNKVIDTFNEYMFEYTSKIPLGDLEKAIEEKERQDRIEEQTMDIKILSPYLKPKRENYIIKYILIALVIIILAAITVIWAAKQVM